MEHFEVKGVGEGLNQLLPALPFPLVAQAPSPSLPNVLVAVPALWWQILVLGALKSMEGSCHGWTPSLQKNHPTTSWFPRRSEADTLAGPALTCLDGVLTSSDQPTWASL